MKQQLKEVGTVMLGMLAWAVLLIVLGVVLRVNWELFMLGWSAL